MPFPYACAECRAQVHVSLAGEVDRPCGHDGATIIAERTSVLYGEGGATQLSIAQRAASALRTLLDAFR